MAKKPETTRDGYQRLIREIKPYLQHKLPPNDILSKRRMQVHNVRKMYDRNMEKTVQHLWSAQV